MTSCAPRRTGRYPSATAVSSPSTNSLASGGVTVTGTPGKSSTTSSTGFPSAAFTDWRWGTYPSLRTVTVWSPGAISLGAGAPSTSTAASAGEARTASGEGFSTRVLVMVVTWFAGMNVRSVTGLNPWRSILTR